MRLLLARSRLSVFAAMLRIVVSFPAEVDPLTLNRGALHRCQHAIGLLGWHLNEAESIRDLDGTNLSACNSRLASDCADEVLRANSSEATRTNKQAGHSLRWTLSAIRLAGARAASTLRTANATG